MTHEQVTKRTMKQADVWQYVLLLNLSIPLYFVLQEPLQWMLPGILALVVILICQHLAIWHREYLLLLTLIQYAIMIALSALYDPMYLYLVFIMVDSIQSLETRWIIVLTIVFAVTAVVTMFLSNNYASMQYWLNLLPSIFGGCVLPYIIRVSSQYREMTKRLQAAIKQIERFAQQEERHRIAQELHDTLGHTLSLIALKSEVIEKLAHRAPDKALTEARDINLAATTGLKRMRELVSDMKIVRLSEEWEHARMLCAAANIALVIEDEMPVSPIRLTPLQESVLGMCIREALTNVVRHSHADTCEVRLEASEHMIHCVISDNGSGIASDGGQGTGNGLVGMKQRLALLEGSFQVETNRYKGTRLIMEIPIVERQRSGGITD